MKKIIKATLGSLTINESTEKYFDEMGPIVMEEAMNTANRLIQNELQSECQQVEEEKKEP